MGNQPHSFVGPQLHLTRRSLDVHDLDEEDDENFNLCDVFYAIMTGLFSYVSRVRGQVLLL